MKDIFDHWDYDSKEPDKKGVYAVLFCWETSEGIFNGSAMWDGQEWSESWPISAFSIEPFEDSKDAEDWAKRNNPENIGI